MKWLARTSLLPASILMALILLFTDARQGELIDRGPRNSSRDPSHLTAAGTPVVVPGVVVVKIKSRAVAQLLSKPSALTGLASLDAKLSVMGATSVQKMFQHKPIDLWSETPDISRILQVQIPENASTTSVAQELSSDPNVEYAEPVYQRRLCEVPNDPLYGQQHYLPQIHAPEAWEVQKGDSTVIIAIIDTGVDYIHEDLAANAWTNALEVDGLPGVDDDGNGFVDDIHGWDFGPETHGNPNPIPPSEPAWYHGTHVAGIACAVTGNQTGIAGVGWNVRHMAVKFGYTNVEYTRGYEGIVYAADNGADVINTSWGGYGFLRWEQEAVTYAHSRGAILVCGAGNDNIDVPFYPASYQHAVSVAAVDRHDHKASYSSYGPRVDISAPGGDLNGWILSTIPAHAYASEGWAGTSMATPVVSGVCALIKSHHPDWSNDQIVRQVLLSAEDIDVLNPTYRGRLGHGRVNAYRALTVTNLQDPDARLVMHSYSIHDSLSGNSNGVPERGETILIRMNIQNCSIGSTQSAALHLSCTSPNVQVLDGTIQGISFPADTVLPFDISLRIGDVAPAEIVDLTLALQTAGGYSRQEQVPIAIGATPILLLDHDCANSDFNPHVERFYRDILDGNNVQYRYWDTGFDGFPPTLLQSSPIVIVACPWWRSSLNQVERDALRRYLDSGGNLFFSGQDIGWYLHEIDSSEEATSFMREYLHAEYVTDNSGNRRVEGIAGDAISSGMTFPIWQPGVGEELQSPDVLAPMTGASTILRYQDGRSGAVKYAGKHKVVYFGFGLEAVDSSPSTKIGDYSPIRTQLFMRVLEWLNFVEHNPKRDVINRDSTLTLNAVLASTDQDFEPLRLFWRHKGDSLFTSAAMTDTGDKHFTAAIPAPKDGTSIEYYFQTIHPYYSWMSPLTAPVQLHTYPIPALILVSTEPIALGPIASNAARCDTSFLVRNLGGLEDTLTVSVDYVNVAPESALTVSPAHFVLLPDASQQVTVSIHPALLQGMHYNALIVVDSKAGAGTTHFEKVITFSVVVTRVDTSNGLPHSFALHQNYPNPFNPNSNIRYQIAELRQVRLVVYDLLGREVAVLVNETMAPGRYSVNWDASGLGSGVYLYKLTAGSFVNTRKCLLIR